MTKVNDLPYSRVTLEETQAAFETFFAAAEKAKCAEDMLAARQELITRRNKFDTAYCLANIRFTQNTADPFYKGEMDYYDEVSPLVHNELAKYFRVMLETPFRQELEAKLGNVLFAGFECAVKAHSEEIVEDEQQENALTTEYSQLMAGMLFDWQGRRSAHRAPREAGRPRPRRQKGGSGCDRPRASSEQTKTRRDLR